MQNPKQYLFTLVFVGCLWLALILGCTLPKENSNSGQTTSPVASPTNTATTSSSPSPSPTSTDNSANNASSATTTAGITMANFNRLQTGMTYAQAVQILGKEGKESGELGNNETSFKIVVYKWDEGGSDAEITVFFKDEKLDSKLQFGLK